MLTKNKPRSGEPFKELWPKALQKLKELAKNQNTIKKEKIMENTISKSRLWIARVMGWIVIVFMLMDGIFKFIQPEEVVQGTLELGYAEHHIAIIGTLGLLSVLLYAFPRTSLLGAVLLTGYWGGAIATHLRLDKSLVFAYSFPGLFGNFGLGSHLAEE